MHVLFSLRNFWYIKTFDSVIRELASRGHTIDVRADPLAPKKQTWDKAATELAKTTAGVTVGMMPWSKKISPQLEVSESLLQGLAFLRLPAEGKLTRWEQYSHALLAANEMIFID